MKYSRQRAHHTKSALVLVDVINAFDFPRASALMKHALPMSQCLMTLKKRLKGAGLPVIYANDNFGQWQSDFPKILDYVLRETEGREIAERLRPDADDYFILKPKHSAFYLTPLELLLKTLGVQRLVLGGLQTDICVLLTAHDAHMRDFALVVPQDCSASEQMASHRAALDHLKSCLHAQIPASGSITKTSLERSVSRKPETGPALALEAGK